MKSNRAYVAALFAWALACSKAEPSGGSRRAGVGRADAPVSPPCGGDDVCSVPLDCSGMWASGPLPTPEWPAGSASCASSLRHASEQYYDDCAFDIVGALSPEQCHAPRAGAIVCEPNTASGGGRRTTTCLTSSDCPRGMVCTVGGASGEALDPAAYNGYCERACTAAGGGGDCVRCDMTCDAAHGACVQRAPVRPAPAACTADCQCPNGVCIRGFCNDDTGAPRLGLCGIDGDCPCRGGACGTDQCCRRADGTVASRFDAECQ